MSNPMHSKHTKCDVCHEEKCSESILVRVLIQGIPRWIGMKHFKEDLL